MTLDEAIQHCEEVAKENRELFEKIGTSHYDEDNCLECAKAHEQLAEWLKELKQHIETWAFVDRNLREYGFACVKYVIKRESAPDIEKWVKIQEDEE